MYEYLSHFSAAYAWGIPYLDTVLGPTGQGRQPDEAGQSPRGSKPEHITVNEKNAVYANSGRKIHLYREVALGAEARRRLGQSRCFLDLYYPAAKLAVEYDSFEHHSTPAEQGRDMLRASALERQGISVLRFSAIQLYDRRACEEFARNLAARVGKRIRIRTGNFEAQHQELRKLLPVRS
ncbi:MAG: endonuclease domain-containing protein [Clostridiales Family XIII bacterium]|jgi:very-short-patch-repair endonuclease|nr:endonuclease domain-containing protein [Clostridiales Family XIII bacterium]